MQQEIDNLEDVKVNDENTVTNTQLLSIIQQIQKDQQAQTNELMESIKLLKGEVKNLKGAVESQNSQQS